jgi:outer membrane protein assembly factor BamB/tetratricopeptide (TPR) repeat protein
VVYVRSEDTGSRRLLRTVTRRRALAAVAGGLFGTTLLTTPVEAQQDDRERWAFRTDGLVRSSPTVSGGTVFIGSLDSMLYAVTAEAGTRSWTFDTDGRIRSSPTVVDETVFVGSGDSNLYALDDETGDQQWAFRTSSSIWSSPTVVDETVFVGSDDGTLYAVDAETGKQQWTFETDDGVWSSPTVADGTVFVGSDDGTLYAVGAETGDLRWNVRTGGPIVSSPTVTDGTVFVGSDDSNVYAVSTQAGERRWTFETGGRVFSSPTVADGTVFVGSDDGNVYALDAETGNQRWAFDTAGGVWSSPTVADGTVFVGSFDSNLYAVDTRTGEQLWAFATNERVFSSPTVVDGTVFIGSSDGNLYAVDAGVSGSSEGSRTLLGTKGHHDEWQYAEQSISMANTASYLSRVRNEYRNNYYMSRIRANPERAVVVTGSTGGAVAIGAYTYLSLQRRLNASEHSVADASPPTAEDAPTTSATETEASAPSTGDTEQGSSDTTSPAEEYRVEAKEAIEAAGTEDAESIKGEQSLIKGLREQADTAFESAEAARERNEFTAARDKYKQALETYQAAVNELSGGQADTRSELEAAIESTRQALDEVITLNEAHEAVVETLQLAEEILQEAIVAFVEDNQTVARIRFRQARGTFEDAHQTVVNSNGDVLTDPVTVAVQPDRKPSSTTMSDLPVIPEGAAPKLADDGIETIDDLDGRDESPWTPAAVEGLVADGTIDEEVATALTLLSWWHGDGSYTFETAETVVRRQQQADYGFTYTS